MGMQSHEKELQAKRITSASSSTTLSLIRVFAQGIGIPVIKPESVAVLAWTYAMPLLLRTGASTAGSAVARDAHAGASGGKERIARCN